MKIVLLIGAFPLTAFATEDDEYVEPIELMFLYSYSQNGEQAQGGELPRSVLLDAENPAARLSATVAEFITPLISITFVVVKIRSIITYDIFYG